MGRVTAVVPIELEWLVKQMEMFESLKKYKDHATEEIFDWTAKWNRWLGFLLSHGYQKVAEGRARFCGLILIQAIIQIAGGVYLGLSILKEDVPSSMAILSVVAGFLSIVVGELGRRHSSASLLRLYLFLIIASATLSMIVLAGGGLTLEDVKNVDISGTKKLEFLEAFRVLLGLLVQFLAVKTAISLIRNMSPPKRAS